MASEEYFLSLVQEREVLYNPKIKDHFNRNVLEIMWSEIGAEMNMSVNECKQKWTNLRNSYARHLRNQNRPDGGEPKPNWHLADSMTFLKDFMQLRKPKNNFNVEDEEESSSIKSFQSAAEETPHKHPTPNCVRPVKRSKQLGLPSQQVVGLMTEFLKCNTRKTISEHPLVNFVKGMLPDYNLLAPRRQRTFKQTMVNVLNDLMDEQDMEVMSTPPPTFGEV